MQRPCSVRQTSSASKVGASATPIVGGTSSRLASRIERGRPIRSETGPHTNPPIATASTTHETVRPARDGLTPKSRESSGRIACVEYIVANIPAAPSMKPARAFWSGSAAFIRTGYAARVSCADRDGGTRTWHRGRTPRSSRSSPRTAASCSTAASRRSSSAWCPAGTRPREGDLWGTWPLYRAPETVLDVHRAYVAAGCDVISTDTWSVLNDTDGSGEAKSGLLHWMDIARTGIRLARTAAAEDTDRPRAVAFSVSDESESLGRAGTARLLARIFEDEPPDLILLETLSLIREPDTFDLVSSLVELGLPLWLSFRRCRHGVCGVYGQHWGPPEGDLFGRAATRFEEMGVAALLINCLPVDHVPGMTSWLRDFTDMPLGVYPNLGHLTRGLWRFDDRIDPEAYARLALEWRDEGAQIIGGLLRRHAGAHRRRRSRPGRNACRTPARRSAARTPSTAARRPRSTRWRDPEGRTIYPLPFPDLAVEPGVFVPTQGSYLLWKHLQRTGLGAGGTCLDVGCGCGILAVQLGAQRRRRGARDRHRPRLGREHARQRVSQRRRGARHRRDDRPLPVGAHGAVRRDRSEPLPDARRSVRGAERASAARLLGPQPVRPLPRAPARPPRSRRTGARPAALDPRPGEDGPAARRPRPRGTRGRLQLLPVRRGLRGRTPSRSRGSRSSRTPTTSRSAATT